MGPFKKRWPQSSQQIIHNLHHHYRKTITCNRQHIKPTPISAEWYLCKQLNKHTKNRSLDNILAQLDKHPFLSNIISNTEKGQNKSINTHINKTAQGTQNNQQGWGQEEGEQKTVRDNSIINNHASNKESGHISVIRTRYGQIIKNPYRLTYKW